MSHVASLAQREAAEQTIQAFKKKLYFKRSQLSLWEQETKRSWSFNYLILKGLHTEMYFVEWQLENVDEVLFILFLFFSLKIFESSLLH